MILKIVCTVISTERWLLRKGDEYLACSFGSFHLDSVIQEYNVVALTSLISVNCVDLCSGCVRFCFVNNSIRLFKK